MPTKTKSTVKSGATKKATVKPKAAKATAKTAVVTSSPTNYPFKLNKWMTAALVLVIGVLGSVLIYVSHANSLSEYNHMNPGMALFQNASLISADGGMRLTLESNGNLTLYNRNLNTVWSTNTAGSGANQLVFQQGDRNLVLYGPGYNVIWSANVANQGSKVLVLQNNANLALKGAAGSIIWSTNTSGKQGRWSASGPTSGPISGPVSGPVPVSGPISGPVSSAR